MSNWMQCVTCKATVVQNPTGICLACQGGFSQEMAEDNFHYRNRPMACTDYFPPEEMEQWKQLKERKDAIEERLKPKDCE